MARASAFDFDVALREFAKVLDVSEADARNVIYHLNSRTPRTDFFANFVTQLPRIELGSTYSIINADGTHANAKTVQKYVQGTLQENVIFANNVAKGAYGTVYLSSDKKRVYKFIYYGYSKVSSKKAIIEEKTREILLEAWIQTILSNDPVYGKFVVPVQGIFMPSKPDPQYFSLYLQMPALSFSLFDRIKKAVDTKVMLNYLELRPVFKELTEALLHFRNKYGFYHRDLHVSNIMYKNNNLKIPMIIDFGRSCLTFNGVTYNGDNTSCESNDMLILMTNLMEVSQDYEKIGFKCFTKELEDVIKGALKTNSGLDNPLNDYIQHYNNFNKVFNSIFHAVYPDVLLPGKPLYDWLVSQNVFPLPNLNSFESFFAFLKNVDKNMNLTMQERRPVVRQLGTRKLIGGKLRKTHRNQIHKN